MNATEKGILEVFNKRLLIRKDEIRRVFRDNGSDVRNTIEKLVGMGYLRYIHEVGSPSFTITQSGMRVLKRE